MIWSAVTSLSLLREAAAGKQRSLVLECLALIGSCSAELDDTARQLLGVESEGGCLERDGVVEGTTEVGKLAPSRDEPRLYEVVGDELTEGGLEGGELATFLPLGDPSKLSRGESGPGGDTPQSLFPAELSRDGVADEAAYLVSLVLCQVVDLVEHEERGLPALREHAEQLAFLSRQGRVGRKDEDRAVCIEQCPACFLIVVPVDGAETRRVDEDHARLEQPARHLQLDPGHLPLVLRVALLGDELRDLVGRDLVTRAIEGHHDRSTFSEGDLRGDGGERQHAGGKNVLGEERVDER